MTEPGRDEWSPFGRGWTTAAAATVAILALSAARAFGAGAYGAGALPFLLLQFVATGVVAGRAVAGALHPAPRALVLAADGVVGAVAVAFAFQTWNTTPSGEPLLQPLFLVLLIAAVAWALVAPPRTRAGARATAAAAALGYLVARAASL